MHGQLTIVTNTNISPEPLEFPDTEAPGVTGHSFSPVFSPALPQLGHLRYDIFTFGSFVDFGFPDSPPSVAGEVRIRESGIFNIEGGSIRGLTLEEDSVALIFDGNIDALNPNSGLVDIAGGTVNLGKLQSRWRSSI